MSLEIILLAIASFSGQEFQTLSVENYARVTNASQTCEEYVRSVPFKNKLRKLSRPGVTFRVSCIGASRLQGFEQLALQATSWPEFVLQDVVILEGKIHSNPEVAQRKSTDAYLGLDLTITTSQGRYALFATDKVTEKKLRTLHGKRVKLRAQYTDTTPGPGSMEQFPTGMDGKPLPRTGYRVQAILD